jgi:ribosome-associated protein
MAKTTDLQLRKQLRAAAAAAVAKKAQDPVILDVRKLAGFCDYFLICHGNSPVQIETITEAVEKRLAEAGLHPAHREGARQGEWRALDYVDFLVHVFSPRTRRFYDLERLWSGAPRVTVETRSRKPKGED